MRARPIILVALTAALLGACGDQAPQKDPAGSPDNPLPALPNPHATRSPPTSEAAIPKSERTIAAGARKPSIVTGQQRTQRRNEARAKSKSASNGEPSASAKTNAGVSTAAGTQQATAPSAGHPCSLVTKAQARTIIGVPIAEPLEAPQGPTCIYQTSSGRQSITLTVQSTDFKKLLAQIRNARTVAIADHSAVCGQFGRPMLYLALGGTRVLTVSGPCSVAQRFAATAVPHL